MPRPLSSTRQPPSASERDADAGAEARHRLVDRVVDDLPDEVVETGQTGGSDVHAGPLADRVEALQDLDVFGAVVGTWLLGVSGHTHTSISSGENRRVTCGYRVATARLREGRRTPSSRVPYSLPEGCHEEVEGRPRPKRRDFRGRPRRVRRPDVSGDADVDALDVAPATSADRSRRSRSRNRSWVAQAGSSTSTTSVVAVELHRLHVGRDGRADGLVPASEHAAHGRRRCGLRAAPGRRARSDRQHLVQAVAQAHRFVAAHAGLQVTARPSPSAMRSDRVGVRGLGQHAGGGEHHLARRAGGAAAPPSGRGRAR